MVNHKKLINTTLDIGVSGGKHWKRRITFDLLVVP